MTGSFGAQVKVVLRKNLLIRKQRIFGTICCEVIIPIFIVRAEQPLSTPFPTRLIVLRARLHHRMLPYCEFEHEHF
jgi:hypothetical protein